MYFLHNNYKFYIENSYNYIVRKNLLHNAVDSRYLDLAYLE